MKLFITGASGFVGAATVRAALRRNHAVVAHCRAGRPTPRLDGLAGPLQRLDLDLRDEAALAAALVEHQPDAVIHLAWEGVRNTEHGARAQLDGNLAMSCAVARAAAAAGVGCFAGIGSQGEYGPEGPRHEDSLPQPVTLYGASKVAAYFLTREIARQNAMRHVWLRLFSAYGPGDNDCWLIPMLIREMLAGRRPEMTAGTQSWDWLHVDDAAEGVLAAVLSTRAAGIYNLGSGQAVRVRDVATMIRDLAAPGLELVFGERPFGPGQIMFMQADIARLCADTGWRPQVELPRGLAETVDWYRRHAG
ncbi:NAD(P)-dependent oxidoreductase [Aestuariivirga litoralis]|uniref:NAD(P)-dependent oxidoreductase n=1 Tax=Aestuariivirga litoralis TaxID=2650924 RepID=A0A2W2B121_9HYPH|nr:NAD(P)-dependent oxidoreductase [Aestuariivirga litoralis]PZF78610.1 NAD(P)-dependent oxidoreductase [Aestuariivirga litoralis]